MPAKIVSDRPVRDFSKLGDAVEVPDLTELQARAYEKFLQQGVPADKRERVGLEGLLREVFPIVSYDEKIRIEYHKYHLEKPRYTPLECRELRLTYGLPLRVTVRLIMEGREEDVTEDIYLGDIPVMMGGGEFIVNGAMRVIVSQLHRSPGIDFSIAQTLHDRPLHSAKIVPERGSWIELEVTKKDVLGMKIDQSAKIAATTFLRALWNPLAEGEGREVVPPFSTTDRILESFYDVEDVKVTKLTPEHYSAEDIVDQETGELLAKAGAALGDALEAILSSGLDSLRVVDPSVDPLILNTIAEEKLDFLSEVTEHEAALLKIYGRLRPGNPPQVDKARELFSERFYEENKYRLGKVGRFRVNRKFNEDVDESIMHIRPEDFLEIIKYMLKLRAQDESAYIDDIDHLSNRRLRTLDELAVDELRKGFAKLRRTVQERMSVKAPDEIGKITDLVNSKAISGAIDFFFGRSELSQVVDQTNPLSMLVHERRLSALGPGGLNRKRAGFEVRDVHISHYGRVCPIETPEGTNIGLICSLGIFAHIDEYGFIQTPYRAVEKGKITGDVVHLRADEEIRSTLVPAEALDASGKIDGDSVLARHQGELMQMHPNEVNYVDVSPKQIVGVSAAMIPFLEHDDANRALMGANMQRQAVPLLKPEVPWVGTGMEKSAGVHSGMAVRAANPGKVTFVDAERIVVDNSDEYELLKFRGLNERTCNTQKPIVKLGQSVKRGQIIADGASTVQGELGLGKNILVAFNTFDGYNFEDAIVISEQLVKEDTFTSIHIEDFDVEIRETKLGREEFTRDIPNVSEKALSNLDETGIVRVGARVGPGDILVGKVSPKSKSELTPEEKLLHAIFGRAGEDVKNDSLTVPSGTQGIVIGTRKFSRRLHLTDEQKASLAEEQEAYEEMMDEKAIKLFREMVESINEITGTQMVDPMTRQKVGQSDIPEVVLEQIENFTEKWIKGGKDVRDDALKTHSQFWPRIQAIDEEKQRRVQHMKRGDELGNGVLEMVKVYVAAKRTLSVGDKMAGRHGNKGVIARIVPEEDMPFLEDGTPVQILLNPLGVPSRMNVGQVLELHMGWAAAVLGFQCRTPVFDGASEAEVLAAIDEANAHVKSHVGLFEKGEGAAGSSTELLAQMPFRGKVQLFDGRTGEAFQQRNAVGYMYLIKLHHLVDDKIHARATGPYSLITQQPLGGKARTGGQRFGEMEVWALEGYGAAFILQELLTVKSDDVEGRTKIYDSMVKGVNTLEAGMPVVFDVLMNEIKGLGMNIQIQKDEEEPLPVL
ncbi:MAG: DNA-directed RNA polymerase subunit beta [Phycisphaerae bacterium]|nr:DNA-directed RNA polymerase subunit beta [Phycisphaerae bacterium]